MITRLAKVNLPLYYERCLRILSQARPPATKPKKISVDIHVVLEAVYPSLDADVSDSKDPVAVGWTVTLSLERDSSVIVGSVVGLGPAVAMAPWTTSVSVGTDSVAVGSFVSSTGGPVSSVMVGLVVARGVEEALSVAVGLVVGTEVRLAVLVTVGSSLRSTVGLAVFVVVGSGVSPSVSVGSTVASAVGLVVSVATDSAAESALRSSSVTPPDSKG